MGSNDSLVAKLLLRNRSDKVSYDSHFEHRIIGTVQEKSHYNTPTQPITDVNDIAIDLSSKNRTQVGQDTNKLEQQSYTSDNLVSQRRFMRVTSVCPYSTDTNLLKRHLRKQHAKGIFSGNALPVYSSNMDVSSSASCVADLLTTPSHSQTHQTQLSLRELLQKKNRPNSSIHSKVLNLISRKHKCNSDGKPANDAFQFERNISQGNIEHVFIAKETNYDNDTNRNNIDTQKQSFWSLTRAEEHENMLKPKNVRDYSLHNSQTEFKIEQESSDGSLTRAEKHENMLKPKNVRDYSLHNSQTEFKIEQESSDGDIAFQTTENIPLNTKRNEFSIQPINGYIHYINDVTKHKSGKEIGEGDTATQGPELFKLDNTVNKVQLISGFSSLNSCNENQICESTCSVPTENIPSQIDRKVMKSIGVQCELVSTKTIDPNLSSTNTKHILLENESSKGQEYTSGDTQQDIDIKKQLSNTRNSTLKNNNKDICTCGHCGSKKSYACEHCGIWFSDEVLHSIHMGCHSLTDPYVCNICGKLCSDKYSFYIHIIRGHHYN